MTAAQLAEQLEVSQRTILRDIEALGSAGFPVYAVRGSQGGFELLDGFIGDLPGPRSAPGPIRATADLRRARIRLSPRGRRIAALNGRPASLRIRRSLSPAGREDWVEAWLTTDSPDTTVMDIMALAAEAEVMDPPELRARIRDVALKIAELHDHVSS